MTDEAISCPVCGALMNHHANKIVYCSEASLDAVEALEEFHECPRCGAEVSRPAVLGSAN